MTLPEAMTAIEQAAEKRIGSDFELADFKGFDEEAEYLTLAANHAPALIGALRAAMEVVKAAVALGDPNIDCDEADELGTALQAFESGPYAELLPPGGRSDAK